MKPKLIPSGPGLLNYKLEKRIGGGTRVDFITETINGYWFDSDY